jgi:hypothetical protein
VASRGGDGEQVGRSGNVTLWSQTTDQSELKGEESDVGLNLRDLAGRAVTKRLNCADKYSQPPQGPPGGSRNPAVDGFE